MNFFKPSKISQKSENVLSKLRDKMRKKIVDDEVQEESKNDESINKEKNNNDINEINKNEELWRVGIICKKECYYLTQDILKILEKNGYEWKIVSSSYKIKVRKKVVDPEPEKNELNNLNKPNSLNVLIQIFGDIDRHNKDEFLVDLHKLSGTVMEFLEFASNFVSSIQQEGLIVTK